MGLIAVPLRGKQELPRAPVEIADAVEMYAREHDRHATLEFIPTWIDRGRVAAGAWVARFTLRNSDKRMQLYQQGLAPKPPTEDVWFHVRNPKAATNPKEPDYFPLDIHQLGVSGIRQFLQRGDTWSGRGEFRSLEEQARLAMQSNTEMRERFRAEQKEASRLEQRDKRRSRFKIPFLRVGIDLKKTGAMSHGEKNATEDQAAAP
jgi:hypothetical protein